MGTWNDIRQNFVNLMISFVNGYSTNTFKEVPDILDMTLAPTSIFNGGFVVQYRGIVETNTDLNAVETENVYVARLQLGFEINQNDGRFSHDAAISDMETVITQRMRVPTYQGSIITQIELIQASPWIFNTNGESGVFGIINIDFKVNVTE